MDQFIRAVMATTIAMNEMSDDLIIARTETHGVVISTVNTPDMGPETALVDSNGAHPVARYSSVEEAKDGHWKWCEKVESTRGGLEVYKLCWFGDLVEAKLIQIVPKK